MRDQRLDRLADVLVSYSTRVKPGDLVAIYADPVAMPLVDALFERCLKAGAHPQWKVRSEAHREMLLALGNKEQLAHLSPFDMHYTEHADVIIALWAELNTRSNSSVDSARQAAAESARKPMLKRFMEREADGTLNWCGTLFPTLASAQDAEMSMRDYEDFVFSAGLLHLDDPAAAWTAIRDRQQRVCDWLQDKKVIRFIAPPAGGHDGTDLTVPVEGGKWINCSGENNFPDGEVFTGPQGADGHVNFTFPAVHNGREVVGARLVFKEGRVVDASAQKNERFLIDMLDQDQGARNMGEIAIGTNYAIQQHTRNTLFDEKIGGSFHMAVGAGYPESGNTNESSLHWDMVCDLRQGGAIQADGEEFYRDGRFQREEWPQPA